MTTLRAFALGASVLALQGCPSAYQATYQAETQRLEEQKRVADGQAVAAHAEASRYAAVVYFAVGSAEVDSDGRRELGWFVDKMQLYPDAEILVQGFADTTGAEGKNQRLSEERALAVGVVLDGLGVPPTRVFAKGYGATSPAAPNDSAGGRRNNRRVEVTVR